MANYQTTVTLAAPPTGNVLLPNGSTVVTYSVDVGAQAAIAALMSNYVPLAILAASPDQMATGAITRSGSGAATSFSVSWPDGATGTFTGTESTSFPGAIDSYTVTHVLAGTTTKTYTQPALTRDGSGNVTNRPAMTVS